MDSTGKIDPILATQQLDLSRPNPAMNLADIPYISPVSTYPRLEPPSKNIQQDAATIFNTQTGIGDKVKAAGDAAINTLGLPEEAATRLLTGNQYAQPGEIPAVQNFFSGNGFMDPHVGAILGNIFMDPLNLVLAPTAISKLVQGRYLNAPLFEQAKSLQMLQAVGPKGLSFARQEDLGRLMENARAYFPTKFNGYLWGLDEDRITDLASAEKILNDSKKNFSAAAPITPQEANIPGVIQGTNKPVSFFQKYFGSVQKSAGDAGATLYNILDDARRTQANFRSDRMAEVGDLLANLPQSPGLNRALLYGLRGVDPLAIGDNAAADAIKLMGQDNYNNRVDAFRTVMEKGLSLTGDKYSSLDSLWKSMDLPKVNPQVDNLKDFIDGTLARITNEAHIQPAARAAQDMIGTASKGDLLKGLPGTIGTIENLHDSEWQYLNDVISAFKGAPSQLSDTFNDTIKNYVLTNKDAWRQWVWGSELAKSIESGQRVEDTGRYALGPTLEKLIASADNTNYARVASSGGRNIIYMGLLGGALDSATKNLTQLINTVTQFGVGDVLQATGKVLLDPSWMDHLKASNVIDRTAGWMQDILANTKSGKGQSLLDLALSPFEFTENLTRGITYTTSINDSIRNGLTLEQAIPKAVADTQKLMFSYSPIDISPYVKDPLIRPFFQFMSYPMKQIELLKDMWMTPDKGLNNQAVKYMVNTGAMIAYANRLGIDMKDAFLGGIIPNGAGGAPMYEAAKAGGNLANDFVDSLMTTDPQNQIDSPSKFWKGLGDFAKMVVPFGRYGAKVTQQVAESGLFKQLFSSDFDVRQAVADHPWIKPVVDAIGIKPDPGIDSYDRIMKLIGFQTTHQEFRQDLMTFLDSFVGRYNEATKQLNDTAALNGDTTSVRDQWMKRLDKDFGPSFDRYGVPRYIVYNGLQPNSSADFLNQRQRELYTSNVFKTEQKLPKDIKQMIIPNLPQETGMPPGGQL